MSDYFGKPTGNLMWTGEGSRWRDERGEEVCDFVESARLPVAAPPYKENDHDDL